MNWLTVLRTSQFGKRAKVAVIGVGSELGEENVMTGCVQAAEHGVDVIFLGTHKHDLVTTIEDCAEDAFDKMEELRQRRRGCRSSHALPVPDRSFTVGRTVARRRCDPYLTTTGTTSTDRVEALVLNAIAGIATAKADGIENQRSDFNLDGMRQAEII